MNKNAQQTIESKLRFFGAAVFLRPENTKMREKVRNFSVAKMALLARENPKDWQCLLMKRNYLDFAWDNIGGNNEENEFPEQTMEREVGEEMGWHVQESMEVCRQWSRGRLQGFVYLVIPTEFDYMNDAPPRTLCDEVQTVEYFSLLTILESSSFKPNVKGRVTAFLQNKRDFAL